MFSTRCLMMTACLSIGLLPVGTQVMAQQSAPAGTAAKSALKAQVMAERADAIYKTGEPIVFKIQLLDGEKPIAGKKIDYVISGDGKLNQTGSVTSGADAVTVKTKLEQPGFVLCHIKYKGDDGKTVTGLAGAGVNPLQIRSTRPEPADFDAFWSRAKAELDKVPMKATLTPAVATNQKLKDKVQCFDIKIDCAGGMPVSGYLAIPVGAKPKSCPALVNYHGAGVRSAYQLFGDAAKGFIALDVNAHGIENGKPAEFYKELMNGDLKNYWRRDCDNPEKIYFRGMFLRVIRSLEYIKSRPEWDGRILVVRGGSQGGAQALVAAGLDPQVTCCVAYVPALCFQTGVLDGQNSGWPRFIIMKNGQPENPNVVKTVPYYDVAHFASRIKTAECLFSTGFIDTTCAPTSVYVAFGNVPSTAKVIIPTPTTAHSVPVSTNAAGVKFIDAHVAKMQGKK